LREKPASPFSQRATDDADPRAPSSTIRETVTERPACDGKPTMRYAELKTQDQIDVQTLHRSRDRVILFPSERLGCRFRRTLCTRSRIQSKTPIAGAALHSCQSFGVQGMQPKQTYQAEFV